MLKALYSGKIIPWERHKRDSDEKREVLRKIQAEENFITEKLSTEDRERFNNLIYLYKQLAEFTEIEVFSFAFSFGALLMVDVFGEAQAMEPEESE